MSKRLDLTLLGTGSSGGVPRIGNDWGVCDPDEPRNRRTRCCALLTQHNLQNDKQTRILIDTSPDLREQLLTADVDQLDGLVYTHDHADQCHGIDDVRVVAMRMKRRLMTFMDAATAETLTDRFSYCFEGRGGYPPILDLQPFIAPLAPFSIDGEGGAVELLPLDQEHGRIRSLGFRVGPIAYCNDVSEISESALEALKGVEVFVVDALRMTPHPSHAHLERALGWIERLEPARSVLTNLHVDMDYHTLRRELPETVEPAYDGMVISVDL